MQRVLFINHLTLKNSPVLALLTPHSSDSLLLIGYSLSASFIGSSPLPELSLENPIPFPQSCEYLDTISYSPKRLFHCSLQCEQNLFMKKPNCRSWHTSSSPAVKCIELPAMEAAKLSSEVCRLSIQIAQIYIIPVLLMYSPSFSYNFFTSDTGMILIIIRVVLPYLGGMFQDTL